jgi:hypothetical protein
MIKKVNKMHVQKLLSALLAKQILVLFHSFVLQNLSEKPFSK